MDSWVQYVSEGQALRLVHTEFCLRSPEHAVGSVQLNRHAPYRQHFGWCSVSSVCADVSHLMVHDTHGSNI